MPVVKTGSSPVALRRARATLVATGGAPWADGVAETIFAITGRVLIAYLTAFCTESLVGAGTMVLGTSSQTAGLIASTVPNNLDVNEWWNDAGPAEGMEQIIATAIDAVCSEDIELLPGGANVTDGTIVFDVWYLPITDNGALA